MKQIILNGVDTGVSLKRYPSLLPTGKDINDFEVRLGYSLPQDYNSFLLNYNGGTCEFGNIIKELDAALADLYCFDVADQPRCMPLRLPKDCLGGFAKQHAAYW